MSYLKAARYSASLMGVSSPPVKAMFTLKPTPAPLPTYNTDKRGRVTLCNRGGRSTGDTERGSSPPRRALRCRGRSSHRRSDAVKGRERWGLRRRPAGCHCRGEHPGEKRERLRCYEWHVVESLGRGVINTRDITEAVTNRTL